MGLSNNSVHTRRCDHNLFPLKTRRFTAAAFIAAVLLLPAAALKAPDMNGDPVHDEANLLSASEHAELENYLSALNTQSGVQFGVITVPSLDGDDIEDFSISVAEKWQLGQKGKDNGALLCVALNEHDVRIETGYGLEGELTDAKCGLIIRNVITPQFKQGNYGAGILAGIKNMAGVATGNANLVSANALDEDKGVHGDPSDIAGIVIFIIVFLVIFGGRMGPLFFLPFMGFGGRRHYRDNWNDHWHSGGGFGGGGGFSGGGGGFGGGGASGHW